MFKKDYLDQFYNQKLSSKFEFRIQVKKAYVVFLSCLHKYVSHFWNTYKKLDITNKNKLSFGFISNLTISDEAIALWLINHDYDSTYKNAQEIIEFGLTE